MKNIPPAKNYTLHCAFFGRPKDVGDCSAVPEKLLQPLVFALFLSRGSQRVCVCVCVSVRVGVTMTVKVNVAVGVSLRVSNHPCTAIHFETLGYTMKNVHSGAGRVFLRDGVYGVGVMGFVPCPTFTIAYHAAYPACQVPIIQMAMTLCPLYEALAKSNSSYHRSLGQMVVAVATIERCGVRAGLAVFCVIAGDLASNL